MYSIGIEIAAKELKVGLIKGGDKPELLNVTFGVVGADFDATLKNAAELAKGLLSDASLTVSDIAFAGIAVEASVCGTVVYGSAFGDKVDLADFAKYLPVKVRGVKTANALALCEEALTYGKGYSLAYITLNEKIGFGLLIDGVPFGGGNGLASEIAHTTVFRGGRECTCGNKGCFEAYCGLRAFENNDYDEYSSFLASGITNVMNLFQPNVIIVGGKVAETVGEKILDDISTIVKSENYARNSVNKTLVALPTIVSNAAVIGAALAK